MKKQVKTKRRLLFEHDGLGLLAERIKEVRKAKGYTQEDLSGEADISLSQIARIETKRINPTVITIFRIAKALDVKVSELFNFKL